MNLHVFHFGEKVQRAQRKGGTVEVGSHSLHLQCAWRVLEGEQVVVGSRDRLLPGAEGSKASVTLCDEKLEALLARHAEGPLEVLAVAPGACGAFRLTLSQGHALEVFPDDSATEQWRYFDRASDEHFVCTLAEEDEA